MGGSSIEVFMEDTVAAGDSGGEGAYGLSRYLVFSLFELVLESGDSGRSAPFLSRSYDLCLLGCCATLSFMFLSSVKIGVFGLGPTFRELRYDGIRSSGDLGDSSGEGSGSGDDPYSLSTTVSPKVMR